ncbi:MAG: alpha/beta fold hydrolase [Caldilineaceae bacterium]
MRILPAAALLAAVLSLWSPRALHAQAGAPASPQETCEDGLQASGATYRICMPAFWNGDLMVYAHGYVSPTRPVGIPEDQLDLPGVGRIDTIITNQGYAFATTGYSVNGLAVVPAQADLIDLVNIFEQKKGRADKVLVAGVSEGGLIAALLAERTPSVFDGVLALCGPYGSFTGQVDYIGDFRVLFDYYFPGLMPPTPVDIPDDLLATWETDTYSTTIKPVIDDPANSATVNDLLKVGGVAYSPTDPATRERSVERMLWYNVYATDDAAVKLGGQPFNNQNPWRDYTGSSNDSALNATVARFTASPEALLNMATQYQTSGRIKIPVVTLHTTLDPVVPIWHQTEYTAQVQAAGASSLYAGYQEASYGHCAFNPLQVLSAFNKLVVMVDQVIKPQLYLPAISPGQP